jgi:cytochrome c6
MSADTVTTVGAIMRSALWWPEQMFRLLCALASLLMAVPVGADGARLALGRQVFSEQAQPSCSICHSLREAAASGVIGPDLDQLKPSVEQVTAAVQGGVGVMPSFAASLSAEQIEAVAHYVAQVAGQ